MKYFGTNILRILILGILFSSTACTQANRIDKYIGVEQNKESLESFQADDFPAIKWDGPGIITPGQLDGVLNAKNTATLGVREYLTGGKYKYIDEFTEMYEGDVLINRIFQYRDHKSSIFFRAANQDGRLFENYVLVTSFPRKNGGCHHTLMWRGKTFDSVFKYVYTKPDTVIEKSQQPAPKENNGCK